MVIVHPKRFFDCTSLELNFHSKEVLLGLYRSYLSKYNNLIESLRFYNRFFSPVFNIAEQIIDYKEIVGTLYANLSIEVLENLKLGSSEFDVMSLNSTRYTKKEKNLLNMLYLCFEVLHHQLYWVNLQRYYSHQKKILPLDVPDFFKKLFMIKENQKQDFYQKVLKKTLSLAEPLEKDSTIYMLEEKGSYYLEKYPLPISPYSFNPYRGCKVFFSFTLKKEFLTEHTREDFSFYLEKLLHSCNWENLFQCKGFQEL